MVAKSIAAGLPLSGVLGRAEIMDAPADSADRRHLRRQPRRAGGGARRARRSIEDEGLCRARGVDRRDDPQRACSAGRIAFDAIGDVRGLGAMLAIELVRDRATKEPAPELATAVVEHAAARGLLLLKAGIYSNCIRVLVPLVIADGELEEALDVWEQSLEAAFADAAGVVHLGSGQQD